MIRGAVAFGLVLRIEDDVDSRSVIVTTSLALVCFTTVFNGSTMAIVARVLFGKPVEAHEHHEPGHVDESHHELVTHPNYDEIEEIKKLAPTDPNAVIPGEGKIKTFMRRFDANTLMPLLIYNYKQHGI